jgi:hypothetical protein
MWELLEEGWVDMEGAAEVAEDRMGRRLEEEDIRAEGDRQVARLRRLVVPEGDIIERIVMAATEKRASVKF